MKDPVPSLFTCIDLGREWRIFAAFLGVFLFQWYARNHTLACVLPALFIAGAITTATAK